ncbi:hypothetical protein BSZ39_08805 [Bowdeniella nasicola]|uniref:Uncharacterized protein n=2 Tax=Bowdeniella nasicola TaxID=208480 RepID=A0A1Q5Q1J4_9ACTO|nr:hypothetical protein BSZ39_08805 [Bowdeniella nasicola]
MLEDLKVGAKVPKEDLERLFPKWEVPEPPATLTEFSEQGAKDAAIYYDRLAEIAFQYDSPDLVNRIDTGACRDCDKLRNLISEGRAKGYFLTAPSLEESSVKFDPEDERVAEVKMVQKFAYSIKSSASGMIESVHTDTNSTNYSFLIYLDGQWAASYLKSKEGEL